MEIDVIGKNFYLNKKHSSRIFMISFLVLSILVPLIMNACSNNKVENTAMVANSYNLDLSIDEYGDMHVVEKINIYNTTDDNNYFYKEIAYNKNNMFGENYLNTSSLQKNVRFTAEENGTIVYDSRDPSYKKYPSHFAGFSYNGDVDERRDYIKCDSEVNCDMIFYYHKTGFSRNMVLTYEYTIEGVITEYKDISEFNWVLLDYQPIKVKNITINLTLPEGDYNIKNMDTFFHGTGAAKREFVDTNKIKITSKKLISDEQIEVRLLLGTDVFSNIREKNKVSINAKNSILEFEADQALEADIDYYIGYIGPILVYVIFIALIVFLFIRCYVKYDREYKSSFINDYHMELPKEYPPAIMGYLYKFREIDDDDLCATLLDLIRRKYLILDDNNSSLNDNNPNYIIRLNEKMNQSNLLKYEKFLIKWFIDDIGDGKSVSSNQIQSYCETLSAAEKYIANSRKWNELVKKEASKYDFFDKEVKNVKKTYNASSFLMISGFVGLMCLIGIISAYNISYSLVVSMFFISMAFIIYIHSFDRRSENGNEDFVRWRAFKKFLIDFSNLKDYPVTSIVAWEHYLVYATSFGIADKVMEQLKIKLSLENVTYDSITFIKYFDDYHSIECLTRPVKNMRTVYASTYAKEVSQRYGGGSGSRGGFSGGSSFGGGGGSFGGGHR